METYRSIAPKLLNSCGQVGLNQISIILFYQSNWQHLCYKVRQFLTDITICNCTLLLWNAYHAFFGQCLLHVVTFKTSFSILIPLNQLFQLSHNIFERSGYCSGLGGQVVTMFFMNDIWTSNQSVALSLSIVVFCCMQSF